MFETRTKFGHHENLLFLDEIEEVKFNLKLIISSFESKPIANNMVLRG